MLGLCYPAYVSDICGPLNYVFELKLISYGLMALVCVWLFLLQIWNFTMKSACCKHEIVIQTDPKNTEYVIISGAQRKTEEFDIEDAETFALPADEGWSQHGPFFV